MLRTYVLPLFLLMSCGHITAHGRVGIREVDFRNLTYSFTARTLTDLPHSIPVRDGLYHSPHLEPSLSYVYFKVAEVVFGDLNGDGREEAAVVTVYGGASSDYYETSVYLYTMKGLGPKLVAILNQATTAEEYERFSHDGRSYLFEAVAGGTKIVRGQLMVSHFAGGGHCCPPNVFTLRFRLRRDRMMVVGRSLRRRGESEERIPHAGEDR